MLPRSPARRSRTNGTGELSPHAVTNPNDSSSKRSWSKATSSHANRGGRYTVSLPPSRRRAVCVGAPVFGSVSRALLLRPAILSPGSRRSFSKQNLESPPVPMDAEPLERADAARVGREAALSTLLVISGAAALLHETAWYRFLVPGLGAGALPAAAVSSGALLGFALGAALGGRRADASPRPARTLALAEVLAAVLSAALAFVLPAWEVPGPVGAAAVALVLAIAATPMGASLPAALRALHPSRERAPAAFRRLYAWNTFGAVAGVLASAAFLLEALGNRGVALCGAGLEAVAALGALALAGRRTPATSPAPPPPPPLAPESASPAPSPRALAAASFLAGAAGLSIQVAWLRRLTPALGPTFQVFAVVLAVPPAPSALCSLLLGPRRGTLGLRRLPWLAVIAALPVAALPSLVDDLARWATRASEGASGALGQVAIRAAAAALVLVPSTAIGAALLPWLLRAASPETSRTGRGAGALLAANALGSAIGALVAASLLVPAIGTAATLRVAAALLVGVAALAASARRTALAVVALAALVAAAIVRPEDRALHDSVGAAYRGYDPRDGRTIHFEEGRVATVLVRDRDGRMEFWVDGSLEAGTSPTDRLHLALLADLPMALLRAQGRMRPTVAVVGLGAGLTAQGVARWRPASLDVFEIERAVADAAPSFASVGGGVPASARVHVEDGRRGIARLSALDLVTSDPVHPAVAGSAWLYSREHYEASAARLAPGGLFWQCVPRLQMAVEHVRLVLRTFARAFAFPYVFRAGPDVLLLGATRPIRVSEERLRDALSSESASELAYLGFASPGALLSLVVRGPEEVRSFAGDGPVNTDDRLLLELRAGRSLYRSDPGGVAAALDAARVGPESLLDAPPSAGFAAEAKEARRFDAGILAWMSGDLVRSVATLGEHAAADMTSPFAWKMLDEVEIDQAYDALDRGAKDLAARRAREVLARGVAEPILRLDAAEVLIKAGLPDEGRAAIEKSGVRADAPRRRRLMGN